MLTPVLCILGANDILGWGSDMISLIIGVLLCLSVPVFGAGEEIALARLSGTTDMLISIGEEMVFEPIAGMLVLQDTVSIDLNLNSAYTYQFVMWTESTFNYVDFWLEDPSGNSRRSDFNDHSVFSIMPDSHGHGIWNLQMELLEGAYSDTAYYAVAVLRRDRLVI